MATSLACTAWQPSLPRMPMPTWAPWIIETSLAPSPTAIVMLVLSCSRTSSTNFRFCCGERRQQTHARLRRARSYKPAEASLDANAAVTNVPSRTRPPPEDELESPSVSTHRAASSNSKAWSTPVQFTKLARRMSSVKSRHARTISTAVSVLSPVSTQKRIPAALIVTIASGTPACSLSSIALMPARFSECSSSAATAAMASSRPSALDSAAVHFARHPWKASGVIRFDAKTKVRKPRRE
mmetsp:Transcript_69354/g.200919  ORF Transcript_69354/g.200919 Transcript_69354/m.200919 type:complete len:240 (-) Transcript_69354:1891-2610(-)